MTLYTIQTCMLSRRQAGIDLRGVQNISWNEYGNVMSDTQNPECTGQRQAFVLIW